jgi:HD-GYP domain-containing protein (c-di-GMP phosphodiesterase class II)
MAARLAADLQSLRYAEDVRRLYHQLRRSIWQSLLGLANALEAKDLYTRGHSERVGGWSRRLAIALERPGDEVDMIMQAGLLHDIGKIGVPEAVLRKRGLVIRHHHERWDGSGYPDALSETAIPLGARIVAVADVFDALTSDRPYRSALSVDTALAFLADEAGRTLDRDVVTALIDLARAGDTD